MIIPDLEPLAEGAITAAKEVASGDGLNFGIVVEEAAMGEDTSMGTGTSYSKRCFAIIDRMCQRMIIKYLAIVALVAIVCGINQSCPAKETLVDSFYRDGNLVLKYDGRVMAGSDAKTFHRVSPPNADTYSLLYADKNQVYYAFGQVISGMDPNTIRQLSDQFAVDAKHVWSIPYDPKIIPGLDPKTFKALGGSFGADAKSVTYGQYPVVGADPATFKPMGVDYAQDKNHAYCGELALQTATDPQCDSEAPPDLKVFWDGLLAVYHHEMFDQGKLLIAVYRDGKSAIATDKRFKLACTNLLRIAEQGTNKIFSHDCPDRLLPGTDFPALARKHHVSSQWHVEGLYEQAPAAGSSHR